MPRRPKRSSRETIRRSRTSRRTPRSTTDNLVSSREWAIIGAFSGVFLVRLPETFCLEGCYNFRVHSPLDTETHEFTASAEEAGTRLDRLVALRFPELSRTRVQELIDEELILLNGKPAKGSQ